MEGENAYFGDLNSATGPHDGAGGFLVYTNSFLFLRVAQSLNKSALLLLGFRTFSDVRNSDFRVVNHLVPWPGHSATS